MKLLLLLGVAGLALGGCASDGSNFSGSPHGYSGSINNVWTDIYAVPTIIQPGETALHSVYGPGGEMRDMPSTFEADAAGNVRATGVAAYLMALAGLCARAPDAEVCGNRDAP